MLKYVIASMPRSGTKYISTVLTKLGLSCGHELVFNTNHFSLPRKTLLGEASWMAVPYLDRLPPGTIVFHQLRDPIKVLNSNLPPGGDSYFRTWDENAGLASDPLYGKNIPWKRFIWENTQEWVWPGGVSNEPESEEEIRRLIHWWENWNLWVEFSTCKRYDLSYIRYRLEDLDAERLQQITSIITASFDYEVSLKSCKEALESVSKQSNRHRKPNEKITLDMIPASARLLMHKYGYPSLQE